mmetsp:Transcript_13532/g.18535  ORF Transcript_13532/g.18535 Transcript_13532/m.18535 type:complete len:185 (-) Transcript_13532:97-651(-)
MERENSDNKIIKTGEVKVKDLVPFFGICCFLVSCYSEIPDCLGAVCENTLCCFNAKMIVCKTSKEEEAICKCCAFDFDIVHFHTCCKSRTQSFCIELRSSMPPSKQIPCLITVCFFTLVYEYKLACKCCTDVRDLVKLVYVTAEDDHGSTADQWVEICDPATYRMYYLNKHTGVSQWEKPENFE